MKRIVYFGILAAAALLLAGILIFTDPGLPLPKNDNGHDEAPAGSDLYLLVMLPFEEGHSVELEHLLGRLDFFKRHSRLPEDITQGSPPHNLEKFELPAALYKTRDWVPADAPLALTFNLPDQTTPAYICRDYLAALIEEEGDSYSYLWLPLKGFETDSRQVTFFLDAGAVLPGWSRPGQGAGKSTSSTTIRGPDAGAYKIVILKAVPEEQDFNPTIGIYSGEGSWYENVKALKNFFNHYGINWREFDEEDALVLDLAENFDMIIFPGGIAAEYYSSIRDHGIIREYVYSGGSFLGICAGAYYAVDMNLWDDILIKYPLGLFPGFAVWPVSKGIGWGRQATIRLEQSHPINSGIEPSSLYMEIYYFDGPCFSPYEEAENVEIVAWYDLYDQPSAVVSYFGKGKALLLGVHPELGYNSFHGTINTHGEEGAHWEWLYKAIEWVLE